MKEGWEIVKLEQVCDIISGRNQKAVESLDGEYPIYGSGGIIGHASDYLCESGATIIGRKGSINNPIYVQTKFWNVDTAFGMLPKPNLNSKLFYYFCLSFDFSKMNKGTTIPSLVKKDLLQIDIPFTASPSEQQRIVDILDKEFEKTDRLRSNAEQNLQNANALFQAALKKELEPKEGWQTRRIGDTFEITDFVSNGSFASLRENVKYYDEPNYAVLIRLADNSSGFNPERFVYIDEHGYGYLSKSKLFGGELIMCNIGATVGTTFICPNLGKPMSIGPNSLLIRTPNNQFFNYYLQNPSFKKKLRGIISKTTLEKFNKTQFKELTITFPSAQECNSIVATLDDLNAKCKVLQDNYTKTIALCDDLKQALLRKAFNGEL